MPGPRGNIGAQGDNGETVSLRDSAFCISPKKKKKKKKNYEKIMKKFFTIFTVF